jgi:hypothetical protein
VTIVVGAASPDGIVIAADSRTTLMDGIRHRISTDAADKVFKLKDFGVATYGAALIDHRTINGLMDEFVATVDERACLDGEGFAVALGDFFDHRYVAAHGPTDTRAGWPLGFLVAGYDDAGIGHVWEVGVPGRTVTKTQVNTADRGTLWRGQVDVIGRLIKGVDLNALVAAGETPQPAVLETLQKLEYILLHPVTLQDAADMAAFLVRTTIDMQRFSDGTALAPGLVPGCGGVTQMLAVTRTGVQWISRRRLVGPSQPGWAEGAPQPEA